MEISLFLWKISFGTSTRSQAICCLRTSWSYYFWIWRCLSCTKDVLWKLQLIMRTLWYSCPNLNYIQIGNAFGHYGLTGTLFVFSVKSWGLQKYQPVDGPGWATSDLGPTMMFIWTRQPLLVGRLVHKYVSSAVSVIYGTTLDLISFQPL